MNEVFSLHYQVEEMLHQRPRILEIKSELQEREYVANLDQEVIYDNYEQVFKSEYIGDTTGFNTD